MSPMQAPQAPPEQFTQADALQAQRLQGALASARKALDDGEIDDGAFMQLQGMIQSRLAPIMQRQQAQQQQMEQQQQQALAKQHAQLQAMEQEAAVFRAKGLPERIVMVPDLLSDPPRIARLYESSPGQWEEIKFEGSPEQPEPEAAEGPDDGEGSGAAEGEV